MSPSDARRPTPGRLPFAKLQGIGNDFVVVDAAEWPAVDWSALSVTLCDRHFGVGGDGLLILETSQAADFRMRMFNPDGTEDDCGNGLRCIVHFAAGRRPRFSTVTVESLNGFHTATVLESAKDHALVRVTMGAPRFRSAEIPMVVDLERVIDYPVSVAGQQIPFTCLNTGSTHAVTFLNSPVAGERFGEISPLIERHPLFPERTSVIWAWKLGAGKVGVRIWERGVGETLACGTGACAAAVALNLREAPAGPVHVQSRGGALIVEWAEGGEMVMTGPATTVFEGSWHGEVPEANPPETGAVS